ncbi:MAG: glycosyltransferase [Vicinamibacterales bacterium]
MPLRVVLSCWGSYGDLFPSIGLALALKARGHAPVIASSAYYQDIVGDAGIGFHAVRPDVDPNDRALMARVMDPRRGSEVIVKELLAPHVRESFEDLWAATEGADVLVTHPIGFAGPLVGARRGMRWLSTVLAPTSLFSVHDFPRLPPFPGLTAALTARPWSARLFFRLARAVTASWTRPVVRYRAELGLPDTGDPLYEGQCSPHGTLALFSRVLASPQPDWPPRTTVTGFPFFNRAEAPSDALQAFLDAGDPPVVFTLGSSAVGAPGAFYDESVAAAEALGCRALLMARSEIGSGVTRPLPKTMLAVDYAPHEVIFPRARAVVHHGGVGTLGQALRAGRPMLVVPHAHDQYDNAERARRAGVARVVAAPRYRAATVASHLRALTSDATYARRATEVAAIVAAEPGAEAACDVIEGGDPAVGQR